MTIPLHPQSMKEGLLTYRQWLQVFKSALTGPRDSPAEISPGTQSHSCGYKYARYPPQTHRGRSPVSCETGSMTKPDPNPLLVDHFQGLLLKGYQSHLPRHPAWASLPCQESNRKTESGLCCAVCRGGGGSVAGCEDKKTKKKAVIIPRFSLPILF